MKMKTKIFFAGIFFMFFLSSLNLNAQFRIDRVAEGDIQYYGRGANLWAGGSACESPLAYPTHPITKGVLRFTIKNPGLPANVYTITTLGTGSVTGLPAFLYGDGYLASYAFPAGVRMTSGTTYSLNYSCTSSGISYPTRTYTVPNEYQVDFSSVAPCLSSTTFTANHYDYINVVSDGTSGVPLSLIRLNGVGVTQGVGTTQFTGYAGQNYDLAPNTYTSITTGTNTLPTGVTSSMYVYNSLINSALTTTLSGKFLHSSNYIHLKLGPLLVRGQPGDTIRFSNYFAGIGEANIATVSTYTSTLAVNDELSIVGTPSDYQIKINGVTVYTFSKVFSLTASYGSISTPTALPGQSVTWTIPTNTTSATITSTITSTSGVISYYDYYNIYPVPTFTSPVFSSTTICSGAPLNINLGSAISTTYSWSATNNSNTTGESTTIQVSPVINNTITNTSISSQNVVYTITPQSTLAGGCIGTAKIVTVTVNPVPTINSISSPTICSESTLNIPISSSVAASYSWLANNNPNTTGESTSAVVSSTINNTIINTSGAAQLLNYTITPQSSIGGCFGAIRVVPVTVNPKPQLTTVTSTNICSGNTFSLNLTSSTPSTYTWIATDNANISGEILTTQTTNQIVNTLTNNVGSAQSFYYVITPTGTIGLCTGNTQSITLTVYPTPTISVSGSTAICNGSFSNLLASGASTYLWSDGSTSNPLVINPTTTENYTVVGTNTLGCIGSNSIALTVNPMPVVNFSLSIDTICEGGCVTFTNSSSIVGDVIASYNWNFADGSFSNADNPIHCYLAAGLYNVSLTATTSNSCSVTFTNSANPILVGAQANANFDYSPASPLPVNTLVTFNNTSTNATSYNWFYGDGNGSSDTDPAYTYNSVGNYIITLIAYNASGCNDTISKSIEIKNALFIPDGFTPDGDIKNENFVILGLESYPDNELKVFNRWGNLVYSKKQYDNSWGGFPNVSSASFGTGKLPAATYFYILELNKGDEKPKTGFVVMQY